MPPTYSNWEQVAVNTGLVTHANALVGVRSGMDQNTKLLVGGVGLAAVWYFFIRK